MGMLAASWNLHTKVEWSSPAREVTVKCSADKYLHVLLVVLYKCAIFTFTFFTIQVLDRVANVLVDPMEKGIPEVLLYLQVCHPPRALELDPV